jgi:hypothetical protein
MRGVSPGGEGTGIAAGDSIGTANAQPRGGTRESDLARRRPSGASLISSSGMTLAVGFDNGPSRLT